MSSGNEKITINLPAMSNQDIKTTLISIYDKINKPPTKEVGYDLFLKLVHKNLYSSPQMNYIINHVSEFIIPLEPKEKDPCIKLLSLIFYSPSNEEESIDPKIYFPYLSPVLTTLQNLIKDSNSTIFPTIANVFAEIVQNIMPTDIEASNIELDQEEKTAYEMMQGFCIYNMKYDDKSNRIVGSLCLTKLVENCPVVLQKQYMKLIWEVIMNLIDKKNFNAKYELLNCLISLILGAENLFSPYAHDTLYKVLDFLTDTDWFKRKLALNVIYTLIFYCKEEILPLKEHIISFLRSLKSDKAKEVREVCLLILKIFSENEQKNKDNNKDKSSKGTNSSINTKKKAGNKLNESKSINKAKKNNINININNKNNTNSNTNNSNSNNTNKVRNSMPKKIGNKFNKSNESDKNSNKFSDCMIPEIRDNNSNLKENKNKFNENIKSLESSKTEEVKKNNEIIQDQDNNNFLGKKTGMNSTMKNNIKENNSETVSSSQNTKLVNRKDDKTFINEKMVIKPDPNKSIFKSSPNPAFFSQANKKAKDIVLVSKGDPSKFKNNLNNNNKNDIIVQVPKEKKETKETNNNDIIVQVPKEKKETKETNKNDIIVQVPKEKKEIKETNKNDIIVQIPKEKKIEKKDDNVNKNNNDISNNKEEINNENNINILNKNEEKENKEKTNIENHIKNKAAPIKRNKIVKKIIEKEKEFKPEEKIESNKEMIDIRYKVKEEDTKDKNIIKDNMEKKEEDVEIKDYKTYLNNNEKIKEKTKTNYDPNIINTLLSQMNSLSEKQLSLIDVMDNIQMETQGQIKQLNKRISKLEKNLEELNNELYYLKNE